MNSTDSLLGGREARGLRWAGQALEGPGQDLCLYPFLSVFPGHLEVNIFRSHKLLP